MGVSDVVAVIEDEGGVVEDVSGDAAVDAGVANLESAGGDGVEAGEGVVAGEGEGTSAELGEGTVAGDDATVGAVVAAVKDEGAMIEDVSGDAAGGAAVADLESAAGDGDEPRDGIVASEDESPRAELGEGAVAGDQTREGDIVAVIENEGGIIKDRAADAAGGSAIADLEGALGDDGAAGVGVGGSEDERAETGQGESAGAGDDGVDGRREIGAVGGAVADFDDRRFAVECDGTALHRVTVHGELHTRCGNSAGTGVHCHRTVGYVENGEAGIPLAVDAAIGDGPIGAGGGVAPCGGAAVNGAVAGGVGAVPEESAGAEGLHDEIDLSGDGGLDEEAGGDEIARENTHGKAVIGERAGVVDEAVGPGTAERAGDVELAVEGEIAIDDEEVVGGTVSGGNVGGYPTGSRAGRWGRG